MFFDKTNQGQNEVREILSVAASFDFSKLKPYIDDIERTIIKKVIGVPFYNSLLQSYNDGTIDETLLNYVRRPLVYLAFWKGYDFLSLKFSDAGIHRPEKTELLTPFLRQEKNVRKYLRDSGWNYIDELLELLEQTLPTGYIVPAQNHLIKDANIFSLYYDISGSRYVFQKLQPYLKQAEDFDIVTMISRELFNDLKSRLASLTPKEAELMEQILPALAYQTIYRGGYETLLMITERNFATSGSAAGTNTNDDFQGVNMEYLEKILDSVKSTGQAFLKSLEGFLRKNESFFPLWKNSDCYFFRAMKIESGKKITVI